MMELLNTDVESLFDTLKAAYYEQTGETLQIGSDEFANASVQAYVWSVMMNTINKATQNRYIDTATGEFLDALAANYGIESRQSGYHATAKFSFEPATVDAIVPANGLIVQDANGNQFSNRYSFHFDLAPYEVVLYAVEPGTKYNGIPANKINQIVSGSAYVSNVTNITVTSGGTDGFPYTEEGDNAYRAWLKTEIQSKAGAGTYLAYESRAKNADTRITDVYVLRQDDTGYEKGKVKISILSNPDTDLYNQCLEIVKASCSDDSFRPIGDLVVVSYAGLTNLNISETIQVTYPIKFSGVSSSRNARILNEYRNMLSSKINKPFTFEEICSMLTAKDDDGVYAIDAKPIGVGALDYTRPKYPAVGGVIRLQALTIQSTYTNRG